MNVDGDSVDEVTEMEEEVVNRLLYMWGYLPGALPQRSPLLSPVEVRLPPIVAGGSSWKDVCGGGCGFAMALSDTGKLITWGSTDDLGQSYVTSGKHGETPEPFPLPSEASIVKAAAGWAHCVSATEAGVVYTWGWKECVPSGKVFGDGTMEMSVDKDVVEKQSSFLIEQASPRSQGPKSGGGLASGSGEESAKRRRVASAKQASESSLSVDEPLSALPCLVTLCPGVRIATVAAGGRHTLALSDIGQVWGWGYGGEGQLGLGSRIRMVSSPHPVPCIESSSLGKDRSTVIYQGNMTSKGEGSRFLGSYITGIACGGRHSAVITDAGALLAFGWGLYGQICSSRQLLEVPKVLTVVRYHGVGKGKNDGRKSTLDFQDECGQGSTDDELSPTCVSSLLGIQIETVAAGLWHTVCISTDGAVYAFGGNQFGQLGSGTDQAEILPRLLDAPSIENRHAKIVSCGARHTAVLTEDSKVFCWGWNKYGQLGLGDVIDRNIPSEVAFNSCVPKNVACGWWHTLLLAETPT